MDTCIPKDEQFTRPSLILRLWRWKAEFFARTRPQVILRGNDTRQTYVTKLPGRPVIDYILTPCYIIPQRRHQFWKSPRWEGYRMTVMPNLAPELQAAANAVQLLYVDDYLGAINSAHFHLGHYELRALLHLARARPDTNPFTENPGA